MRRFYLRRNVVHFHQRIGKILRNGLKNKFIYKPNVGLNGKDEFNANIFTEWQPGRVQQIYLPDDGRNFEDKAKRTTEHNLFTE